MANLTLNRDDRIRTWGLILAGLIIFAGAPMLVTSGNPIIQHDTTTLGTWYNVPTSCTNHDNCELFGNGMNISNDNWGLRQIFSVGNNTYLGSTGNNLVGYSAHLNLDCIDHLGGPATDYRLNFTLEYSIYGDYNGAAASPPTYSSNLTGWQVLESLPVDADMSGAVARQGCTRYATDPTATSIWTETGPDVALNSTAVSNTGQLFSCSGSTIADCGYIFRVVLCCATNTGESVEFGTISITILQSQRRQFGSFTSSTATTLSYALTTQTSFQNSAVVTFTWFATNVSSTGKCGVNTNLITGAGLTDHCWETNTASCTFLTVVFVCPSSGVNTITYATAFTGTVRAWIQNTRLNTGDVLTRPITTLTVFTAQPVPNV